MSGKIEVAGGRGRGPIDVRAAAAENPRVRCSLTFLVLGLLALVWGCDAPRSGSERPGAEEPARPDSASRERLVVLRAGPLHLERDLGSPGVTEVQAGTLLDVIPDSAAGDEWVRVATWDDRRGWIEASRLMEPEQWLHYGRALGGVSPILLRPAYPVEGGWAVEAPLGSPGLTSASSAWLLGDSARGTRILEIDSLENICGGERHRFGVLDLQSPADDWPLLEEGLLATPSGSRPTTRRLAVGPLDPDPGLVELARRAARELGPSGATGPVDPVSIEWSAFGEDAAWAALSWPVEDVATGQAQLASALVFRRAGDGWEGVGTLGPLASSAEIPTPAWRPVAAYSTGAAFPTVLLLEGLEYEGAHLDIWIERGDRYERIYEGYYWGC
ncbi:MAG TPA: SH3 domain-containing protein [Gemmatimonadota bacterium]|nr:SH3 domain-containing protein [Gemmatimonadota bacterium]